MKRIMLSLAALAILAACNNQKSANTADTGAANSVNASVVTDTANAAAFKFEKESYDFGQITEGEQVTYEFSFTNVGKSPLIITDASATFGCTVPEFPKEPVAPGQGGKIHVVFSSKGKSGMQNKVITLIANTVPSNTELHLIGDVKPAKTN